MMQLAPAELVFLDGSDAVAFAHAQFTSDVKTLATGRWQWSAWLDAQGRARHFFLLARTQPEQLLLWLPLGSAAAMRDGLVPYVFRSKVRLAAARWNLCLPADDAATPAANDVISHHDGFLVRQPGGESRVAFLSPTSGDPASASDSDRWRADDIVAGLPLLAPEASGRFVPQALELARLDAIRFDKGCYPGQEIAARLHFRGGNKRRLERIASTTAPPAPGTPLRDDDGNELGVILYATRTPTGSTSLAVVRIEDDSHQGTEARY